MSKVIAIIGARERDSDEDLVLTEGCFLRMYVPGDTIVSGGCSEGGDRFAEILAGKYGVPIKIYHPDKSRLSQRVINLYGMAEAYRRINYSRNSLVARDATHMIACVTARRRGGTEDTIQKFLDKSPKMVPRKVVEHMYLREGTLILVPQVPEI